MVDFRKKLKEKNMRPVDANPISIYSNLDRKSEKSGGLRSAQHAILEEWFENEQNSKDIILKMNTGSGKTITGLLILESRRISSGELQIYLCNTKNLVNQTMKQAELFGIGYCGIGEDNIIPNDAVMGKKILITTVSKFFNGKSIFGLENSKTKIDGLVIDDAHTSTDIIRKNMQLLISKKGSTNLYNELFELFSEGISSQGLGTYADIKNYKPKQKDTDPFLPVPYWIWQDLLGTTTKILSKYQNIYDEIRFSWPILKDNLRFCSCIISATKIEIVPLSSPIIMFDAYISAKQRIFMSATTSSDTILIKDFDLESSAVESPLVFENEKWSGEKLVAIPSLMSTEYLNRADIVKHFGSLKNTKNGIVAITPTFYNTNDWEKYGASIAKSDNFEEILGKLKDNPKPNPVVIVNRYDGVDLPDDECRVLIIDGLPQAETLHDKYLEKVTKNSYEYKLRISQKIEQAMGRSVRADTDYSTILLIGSDLIKFIRNDATDFLSPQADRQIRMGMEFSSDAKNELTRNHTLENALKVLDHLLAKSLNRDEFWKQYYRQEMQDIDYNTKSLINLNKIKKEKELIKEGVTLISDIGTYNNKFYKFLENKQFNFTEFEKSWYLQFLATINYQFSSTNSMDIQKQAYSRNKRLLKPENVLVKPSEHLSSENQNENIKYFISKFEDFEKLFNFGTDLQSNLQFGIDKESFEDAIDNLGKLLGFSTDRPDEYYKEGPDNVWFVEQGKCFSFEDKSEVDVARQFITKHETGQFANSENWMAKNYSGTETISFMIIPTKNIETGSGASFSNNARIIKKSGLRDLRRNLKKFINSFQNINLNTISANLIGEKLIDCKLTIDTFEDTYSEHPKIVGSERKSR
ncbi:DEAD/DEAH box helicase family protein [Fructobacillus tropaeoli]|uniref:DEAD/DEAH box helicase family protein n=1 Tax=Fructobacillus tropaeoli TaxID=709323 RepID=UPI002D88FA57|nr:Rad3-related DNA helicase DinG (DinG) [Fructobacillus tropaeoli]